MLIALVAIITSAETYNYLKFTKTNGSTVTYSVEGLKLTYDASNVTVSNVDGTATIALADVQNMYFSNEAGGSTTFTLGDVNNDGEIDVADVTALIGYILGSDEPIILEAANCDGKDAIDVGDVTALISYILSGSW